MDETRLQAYLQLIQTVLTCPNGEEAQILQDNSELLDREFMQACDSVAGTLTQQGQDNPANFLRNLARQVGQFLGMNDGGDSDNSEGENPQEYAKFILELLQAEKDSNNDIKVIYSMLEQRQHLLNDRFAEILHQVVRNLIAKNPEAIEFIIDIVESLSNHISQFPLGKRANNLEIAITGYKIVLNNREPGSDYWGQTQNNLAIAYYSRIRGEKAENIENAIASYTAALGVLTREAFPKQWAQTQNNLAAAYYCRIRGEKAENIEQAITFYTATLEVRTREAFPEQWAQTQNNLAATYYYRIKGEKAENIEMAILFYTQALEVLTREAFPQDWATTQNNLAAAYSDRIRGEKAENIEMAIPFYTAALEVRTRDAFPQDWAGTQNNLASTYYFRIRGEKAENIEMAISFYTAALSVYTREAFPEYWATTQNNLAAAYRNRIRGKKAQNIEMAIVFYTAALEVYKPNVFPEQWATTQNNLAAAYRNRIKGEKAENIEMSIECYTAALSVYKPNAFPQECATTQNNLAIAYINRIEGEEAENIENGIGFFEAALTFRTRKAFPEDWAITQNNLALAYSKRINGSPADNLKQAIELYENALTIRTREAFPQGYTETLSNLGNLYRSNQQWQLAYDTFSPAIETVEFLRGEIHSGDESKQKLAEEWSKLYRGMVEVCIELKRYTEAIEYVERSKARNLGELLATRDLYPKGEIPETVRTELQCLRQEIEVEKRRLAAYSTPNSTHLNQLRQRYNELYPFEPIQFDQIQKLINNRAAIIEWYFFEDCFRAFIITDHDPQPIVWKSSTKDLKNLQQWVDDYLNAYYAPRQKDLAEFEQKKLKKQWQDSMASRLQTLADILHINDILNILLEIPATFDEFIIVPYLYLHLFPLHALPVTQETWSQFNKKRKNANLEPPSNPCLLDCFPGSVRYAPSCQLLQRVQQQQRPNFNRLFGVQNPTQDRKWIDLAGDIIQEQFTDPYILKQARACKTEIIGVDRNTKKNIQNPELLTVNTLLFLCHGNFNLISPLDSALYLANEEPLTLAEIFEHFNLPECRLVTISACETGLIDFNNTSDEYIGLPSGFLVAGSSNVVSSLWSVTQDSTALLMIKFYENLQKQPNNVAAALNQAQCWLRDTTVQGFQNWLIRSLVSQDLQNELKTLFNDLEFIEGATAKPYQSPYHWAAFCAIGQGVLSIEYQQKIEALAKLLNKQPNLLSVQDSVDLKETAINLTESDAEKGALSMSEYQQSIEVLTDLLDKRPDLLSARDWADLQETAINLTENDAENWVVIQNWIGSRPQIEQGYQAMKRLRSSSSTLGPGDSKSSTEPSQPSETSKLLLINSIIKNSPLSEPPPPQP